MIFLRKASGIGFYTEKKATTLEFKKKSGNVNWTQWFWKNFFFIGFI